MLATMLMISLLTTVSAQTAEVPKPTVPPEPAGMVSLFNGKDLAGWDGDPRLWSARDGAIRGETTRENPTQGNTFLIWKGGELGDFELRLSFRIQNGNSGIQYRSRLLPAREGSTNNWRVGGYQAEVENAPGKVGFLFGEAAGGWLCDVGNKVVIGEGRKPQVVGSLGDRKAIGSTYKMKDWNDYVIIAKGNHLVHYLNGIQTVDVIDNDEKGRALSGILALQIHAGPPMVVEFKDIRLKQYDTSAAKPASKE
jgi:hypothetical protein